jgi:two-component system sensor histidine kinase SenX3
MAAWRRREPTPQVVARSDSNVHLSLTKLRTALNALPMGVIIVDEDGGEWWRNRAAHQQSDAASDGQSVEVVLRQMAQRALRGRAEMADIEIDGPPQRFVQARSIPLVNGGALVVLEDVTERILTDKVRTDFVSNISHELKTPVGALSILAETIAAETEADGSTSDLVPLAKRMVAESHRVARTIDDLLELASIEFRGAATEGIVQMNAVVDEAVARVAPLAGSLGVLISKQIPEIDLRIAGHSTQIVSAVANLVENAVKYSERGDTVLVGLRADSGTVEVEVSDEGIGIAPEHVDRVFERFYRVDQARSRETGGTGLGLAIVRHVVTNHGGEVNVRSTEGEGSVFTLTFPAWRG